MAKDYNQILLDKGYTQDQINQMKGVASSGGSAKDIVAAGQTSSSSTPKTSTASTTSTTKTSNSTPTTYTTKSEYGGQGTVPSPEVKDTSWDTGNGTYTFNPKSGYYESKPQTSTGGTSTGGSSTTPDYASSIRSTWDKLTPEKQQELLKNNPDLKNNLARYGLTPKTAETPTETADTGTKGGETPKSGDGWDYQDNSQARMDEIQSNLDKYRVSDPYLFDNYDDFYNFFIAGKGRTPEQEKVINDYFNRMKKYSTYDNLSSSDVGSMAAYGKVPEDYISYLKYSDPQRYAEIQEARKKEEDKIKADSTMDTISSMTGEGGDDEEARKNKFLKWMNENGMFIDKDGNWVDDRMENYASEEEKGYQKKIAELYADVLDIDNTVKHTYDDLVERYPGASKATLMAMANDRNSDLLREKENMMVELTKLQGYVGYMQEERQEMNRAGEQSITNLQKNYGMYLESPEGIAEMAQAQYAATNITLDQADNGTDTEKQMALDRVLSDYYDKYGSIIERSKSQVINDVMAYAKKNGVSLSKALEDNFITPLRAKPGFDYLSSGGISPQVSFEKVGDTGYIFTVNPDGTYSIDTLGGAGVTYGSNGVPKFGESIRTGDTIGNDINSIGHILDSEDGLRIGTYKSSNGYTYNVYADREDGIKATENLLKKSYYGMSLQDAAQKWIGQGKDISAAKKVIKDLGLGLNDTLSDDNVRKFIEAMGKWEGTLKNGQSLDDWAKGGNNDFSAYKQGDGDGNGGYDPLLKDFFQKDPTKLTKDQWSKLKNMGYDERTYLQMRNNYLKGLAKEPDASTVKILDTLGYLMTNYPGRGQLMTAFGTQYLPGGYGEDMADYLAYVDYIKQNLTMDNLTKLKANGATFGSLTEGEWPRIEASATRLKNSMSEDAFIGELLDIYNTYAKNAGMGELTLDDINNMYGVSNTSTTKFNAPSYATSKTGAGTTTDIENWDLIMANL